MTDREKVIKSLETCSDVFYGCKGACSSCAYSQMEKCFGELVYDAIALLKEHEEQKFFVDESGKITPLPVVVRCKDCKHWEQSNGHCPFNSIFTNEDWFCADGERR